MIIVACHIVSPPLREWNRGATSTKDRKRQDKQARQASAIKGTSNEVRVVFENSWAVVAKIELREHPGNDPAHQHTCLRLVVWEVTCVLEELREVDLVYAELANLGYELLKGSAFFMTRSGGVEQLTW